MGKVKLEDGPYIINYPTIGELMGLAEQNYRIFYICVDESDQPGCIDIANSTFSTVKEILKGIFNTKTAGAIVYFKVSITEEEIENEENE